MQFKFTKKSKGFTLLEILLVVGIISLLAGIVIVAINPGKQLASVRNTQRQSDIKQLNSAITQYYIKEGRYPSTVLGTLTEICDTGTATTSSTCGSLVDLSMLVPTYITAIPKDPQGPITLNPLINTAHAASGGTGYYVMKDTTNKLVVASERAELNAIIAIGTSTNLFGDGVTPPVVELWTPADASGLSAWIDLADESSISLSGTNITAMSDKSGNNRWLSTPVGNYPTYDSIDNAAVFTQSQWANAQNPAGIISTNSLIIAVYSTTNSTVAGSAMLYFTNGTFNPEIRIGSGAAGLNMYWYYNGGYAVNTALADSAQQIISAEFSGDVNASLYRDGNAITNGTRAGSWSAISNFTVGANRAGRLYELICITNSISDRQKVEGYLAHKWGLTINLPSGHPYKNSPPTK